MLWSGLVAVARNFRVETWRLSAAGPVGGGGGGAIEVGQEKLRGKFCACWETQVCQQIIPNSRQLDRPPPSSCF